MFKMRRRRSFLANTRCELERLEPRQVLSGIFTDGVKAVLPLDDGARGYEPWETDGTTSGTRIVTDVTDGSGSNLGKDSEVFRAGSSTFYYTGLDLWRTDGGSPTRVLMLSHIRDSLRYAVTIGTELWIGFGETSLEGYRIDGAAANPVAVATPAPVVTLQRNARNLPVPLETLVLDGKLALLAPRGDLATSVPLNGNGLWITDGTSTGTRWVADEKVRGATVFNGNIHYSESDLSTYHGIRRVEGTSSVEVFRESTNFTEKYLGRLSSRNGRLYGQVDSFFFRFGSNIYVSSALHRVDFGSATTLVQVSSIVDRQLDPTFNSTGLYRAAGDGFTSAERETIEFLPFDGSPVRTIGPVRAAERLGVIGERLIFIESDTRRLMYADARTGTFGVLLNEVDAERFEVDDNLTATPELRLATFGGRLVISSRNAVQQRLVATDGTPAGTSLLGIFRSEYVRLYRAYNPVADYHFFTTSFAEFANAVANGYRDEASGQPGFAAQRGGEYPLYRLYNLQTGRHYYTLNPLEKDMLVALVPPTSPDFGKVGWRAEGTEGALGIAGSNMPSFRLIYRLYNVNSGVHLYTAFENVRDSVLAAFPGIWVEHSPLGHGIRLLGPIDLTGASISIPSAPPQGATSGTALPAIGRSLAVIADTFDAVAKLCIATPPDHALFIPSADSQKQTPLAARPLPRKSEDSVPVPLEWIDSVFVENGLLLDD